MSASRVAPLDPTPDTRERHLSALGERRAREAAARDREERRRRAERRDEASHALSNLPAEQPEPDLRGEAAAQLLAVASAVGATQIAAQVLVDGVLPALRFALLAGGAVLGAALAAAAWVTWVSHRRFWRAVGWVWAALWSASAALLVVAPLSLAASSLGPLSIGLAALQPLPPLRALVSLLAASVAFLAFRALAQRVHAQAERTRRNAEVRARRAALLSQLDSPADF